MTRYRVKTMPSGELELWERVGDEWARSNPCLHYDLEFEVKEGTITSSLSADDIWNAAPLDDEIKKILDSCPFELHVQKPCKTKPFTEIELPPGATPVQIDWKDDDGEWHNFFEKKPKRGKWHRVEDELPNTGTPVLILTKFDAFHIAAYISRWVSPYTGSEYIDVTHWRELPKPPKEISE